MPAFRQILGTARHVFSSTRIAPLSAVAARPLNAVAPAPQMSATDRRIVKIMTLLRATLPHGIVAYLAPRTAVARRAVAIPVIARLCTATARSPAICTPLARLKFRRCSRVAPIALIEDERLQCSPERALHPVWTRLAVGYRRGHRGVHLIE
eukprot:7083810-Prymnesium_polylepis.4